MPDRFSVRDVQWACFEDGFWVTVTTDVPAHLWMRWSRRQPWIHSRPVERRGLRIVDDVRFCFTVYNDLEQKEPGDTLLHTFILTPWPVCETRWFYFWGYIGGEVSPSTSPIFKLHYDSDCPVVPPVPPAAIELFYAHIANRPQGELYIGLGDDAWEHSIIYRSLDYGNHWQPLITSTPFGGRYNLPMMIMPTPAGYLALVWHQAAGAPHFKVWHTSALSQPWSIVLGGDSYAGLWRGLPDFWSFPGGNNVWVSGQRTQEYNRPMLHLSRDGGLTWAVCYTLTMNTNPSKVRVNLTHTKGLIGSPGPLPATRGRRSDNPDFTPGYWPVTGSGLNSRKFGVSWPYAVWPYRETYFYSSDNGVTSIQKPIHPDMFMGSSDYPDVCIDCSPSNFNRVLSALPTTTGGVWLSTDFGVSWTKVLPALGHTIAPWSNSVQFDLFNPNVAYAWGKLGFFRSDDAGETWTERNNGLGTGL